ncbi:MAG: hypothetical protein LT070_04540 [Solirubrobacteraceae bacterium]|nr:hypothetical protein [Solirubrobacteraceae bacterium]
MTRPRVALIAVGLLAAMFAALSRVATRTLGRPTRVGEALIGPLHDDTTVDADGACRSVQSADMQMPTAAVDAIWSPMHLERLARTYWRFLTRATLGLVRVEYTDGERFVVLVRRPFVLLAFKRPEYWMDQQRGIVRWQIERGVLVAPPGVAADGYLEIDVSRGPGDRPGTASLHVEVEVANYYPRIASALTQWAYAATQSRVHVLVTYAFLRSLARLDLAVSRVGLLALADIDEVPDPAGPLPHVRADATAARRVPSATP